MRIYNYYTAIFTIIQSDLHFTSPCPCHICALFEELLGLWLLSRFSAEKCTYSARFLFIRTIYISCILSVYSIQYVYFLIFLPVHIVHIKREYIYVHIYKNCGLFQKVHYVHFVFSCWNCAFFSRARAPRNFFYLPVDGCLRDFFL